VLISLLFLQLGGMLTLSPARNKRSRVSSSCFPVWKRSRMVCWMEA